MPFAIWVHEPTPFLGPHWGNFGIRYYGLGYILGFLGAAWLFFRYARAGRSQLPPAKISDFMMVLVLGVLVGGRLGSFLLYHPEDLWRDPMSLLRVWEGGMASHGGFIGVTLAFAWFARRNRIPFLHLGDLVVSAAPIGLLLVRIANYLNGELWGKVTTVSWGVIFAQTGGGSEPRHPSQLYEAFFEGAVLLAYMQWRFWRTNVVRDQPGRLGGEFLITYAIARGVCELFREPDASLILGLSRGTFYSLFLVAAGVVLIVHGRQTGAKAS